MVDVFLEPFHFSSNFECGNLAKIEHDDSNGSLQSSPRVAFLASGAGTSASRKPPKSTVQTSLESLSVQFSFKLWTKPDCGGTEYENNNRTWFCFYIKGGEKGQRVRLTVMNLNKQLKLFTQGMQPVVQCLGLSVNSKWERIKEKCSYYSEDNSTVISWVHTVNDSSLQTYYAFTYPYTYTELQNMLAQYERRFLPPSDIYFYREVIVKSIDGWRVDLLTVTSHKGQTIQREDRLSGLFPDISKLRPYIFIGKKIVFISARVHPGETSSSFVLNGFLRFIVSEDPRAKRLRDAFVFKIIPMLNPDGVIRGHYRTDQHGVNLNRVYVKPSLDQHPTIYAARKIILYHHYNMDLVALLKAEQEDDDKDSQGCESEYKGKEASISETIHSSLLDEDTCHSFSDAVSNKTENVCTHKSGPSMSEARIEVDEPSASGWDVSSNISIDCPVVAPLMHCLEPSAVHDDCSNVSFQSDIEATGVTSMFKSLSPLKDFSHASKIMGEIDPGKKSEWTDDSNYFCGSSSSIPCSSLIPRRSNRVESSRKPIPKSTSTPRFTGSTDREYGSANFPFLQSNLEKSDKSSQLFNISESKVDPSCVSGSGKDCCSKKLTFQEPQKVVSPPNTEAVHVAISSSESEAETGPPGKECKYCVGRQNEAAEEKSLVINSDSSSLFLYVDLHGHASKRGIFIYGNCFENSALMVENMLFPKLMSLNCPNFDFTACNFSERNMFHKDRRGGMSKEGSGRVAIMKATGLLRSYTLECNYNTGRTQNPLPPSPIGNKKCPLYSTNPPKYTPAIFEDCGEQLGVSLLDLIESHECSRIPQSQYASLAGIRIHLHNLLNASSSSFCSPRIHSTTPNRAAKASDAASLQNTIPFSSLSPRFKTSPSLPSSPQIPRVPKKTPCPPRSFGRTLRTRRHSWTLTDAENQAPSTLDESAPFRKKAGCSRGTSQSRLSKQLRGKPTSPKKGVPRSLSFTLVGEGAYSTSDRGSRLTSKPKLTSSVTLTPNLNVKLSIAEQEHPKLIKRMERVRKQRPSKVVSMAAKKLKTNVSPTEETSKDLYSMSKMDDGKVGVCDSDLISAGPISPRSPLASVCEPQEMQGVITLLPQVSVTPAMSKGLTSKILPKTLSKSISKGISSDGRRKQRPLSKSMEKLPSVSGQNRLKLMPKKVRKKSSTTLAGLSNVSLGLSATSPNSPSSPSSSRQPLDWMLIKKLANESSDTQTPKMKKRKKSFRKVSL